MMVVEILLKLARFVLAFGTFHDVDIIQLQGFKGTEEGADDFDWFRDLDT